jgi:hypothetical protein
MTALYVMESEVGVKIGISKSPDERLRQITNASGMHVSLRHTRDHESAYAVEQNAHKLLADKRRTGEWFNVTVNEAIAAIDEAASEIENSCEPQEPVSCTTVFKERLRRIAERYRKAERLLEEVVVWRVIDEVFETPLITPSWQEEEPVRKGGRR